MIGKQEWEVVFFLSNKINTFGEKTSYGKQPKIQRKISMTMLLTYLCEETTEGPNTEQF